MKNKFWTISLLWLFSSAVLAAGTALDTVRQTTDRVLGALQSNQATLKSNPQVVYRIVNEALLPQADLSGMARSVVPRDVWLSSSAEQQQEFIREFTTLLVRTYSAALANYTDQVVEFLPSRGGSEVRSRIMRRNGQPIEISYRMVLQGSEWKLNDFSVEGVSMLDSFRSQFAAESHQNLKQLTQSLKSHNDESR